MALRLARQRSILLPASIFEVSVCRGCGASRLERFARHTVWTRDQRRFTQVIQGKKVPFFQRSITSTPNRLSTATTAVQEVPDSISHSVPPATSSPPTQNVSVIRRKSIATSPTVWTYLELSKPRLSVLILLTTMSAYALAPYPTSLPTLLFVSTGTFLCIASANTFNMISEPEFDALMSRTRNRPLVRNALTVPQAKTFGIATCVAGITILGAGVNPVVAALGAGNIFLYAAVYTPLKRRTIVNTWVGAVVGAIPPLMGWAACSDGSLISHPAGLLLAALLYAWQFPHFNALSYTMRHDYARAGYKMMAATNPQLNARVALRYSIACLPICWGLVACGLVDPWYLLDSTLVNGWVCWQAWKFWREGGEKGSARGLFFASLVQLPAILVLAMLHKVGLWDWLWDDDAEELAAVETEQDEMVGGI